MHLDHNACYRIFCARDARFDGRVFIGVRTTGIYCRPICPAPPPKKANVNFFETAVAAQQAGFRPCLRCRPEVSPQFAAWRGSSSTVSRALRLIESGALDSVGIEEFADRLGMGARQLRRLFIAHVGAPPTAFAQMRRVHLAKQLLQETSLPLIEVAHAAGYRSVRRFNEAFASMFGRSPGQFRRAPEGGEECLTLHLGFAPPYDWNGILAVLAARAIEGVEAVTEETYCRTVREGDVVGTLAVRISDARSLAVELRFSGLAALPVLIARVRTLFDLAADPEMLAAQFGADPLLASRLAGRPGVRVPGAWDAFEHVVRVAISWFAGPHRSRNLLNSFARRFGAPLTGGERLTRLFPTIEDISDEDICGFFQDERLGLAISSYASCVRAAREPLSLQNSLDEAIRSLTLLQGFDPGLAQLCATGFLHPTDAVERGADSFEGWRPWRAYAAALAR